MRALAHFSVTVEEPPCLALPFKHIRQHIRSDSILLEGDDGEEYKARLFIRSKSSKNIYVAEGWSRFERAHDINEGDILFCMLLEGPKLKISVAEKTGRQNAKYYTDSSSSSKTIFKKRKFEMQDPDSESDSESRVLKKRRKGIRNASRKVQMQSTEYSREDDTDSSIKEFFKKRKICSRKNVLKDLNSESKSGSQSSIWEKKKKTGEARSWRRVERHSRKELQSLKKKAQTVAEPESSKRKEVLERIHAFESKLRNPYQILELTMKKLNKRAAVPKEFALHLSADNGNYLKLMVSGHEQWKVKWINTPKFEGFGKGWLAFVNKHNLALGDYIMLEITGPRTIAVHIFSLDHHSSIQGKHEEAYHLKCKSENVQMTCSSESEHEQISLPPYKSTCKIEPCTSSMSNSS